MIETRRLLLRPFQASDWRDLYAYLSDPEVVRYEPYEPFSEVQSRDEAAKRVYDPAFWAVCLKGGRMIGNLYLHREELDCCELGFVFAREFWGKGYALESAAALIEDAFQNEGVRRIIAMCSPENERSWKLMERLGMRREGHFLKNIWFKRSEAGNPVWQDTYAYGLLREEWFNKEAGCTDSGQ